MLAVPLPEAELGAARSAPALALAAVNAPGALRRLRPGGGDRARCEARLAGAGRRAAGGCTPRTPSTRAMMEPVLRAVRARGRARSRCAPPRDPVPLEPDRHLDHRRARRPIPATGRATCAARCASPTASPTLLRRAAAACCSRSGPGRTLAHPRRASSPARRPPAGRRLAAPPARRAARTRAVLLGAARPALAGRRRRSTGRGFHAGERRRRVPLPTYPFERQRYWIDGPAGGCRRGLGRQAPAAGAPRSAAAAAPAAATAAGRVAPRNESSGGSPRSWARAPRRRAGRRPRRLLRAGRQLAPGRPARLAAARRRSGSSSRRTSCSRPRPSPPWPSASPRRGARGRPRRAPPALLPGARSSRRRPAGRSSWSTGGRPRLLLPRPGRASSAATGRSTACARAASRRARSRSPRSRRWRSTTSELVRERPAARALPPGRRLDGRHGRLRDGAAAARGGRGGGAARPDGHPLRRADAGPPAELAEFLERDAPGGRAADARGVGRPRAGGAARPRRSGA